MATASFRASGQRQKRGLGSGGKAKQLVAQGTAPRETGRDTLWGARHQVCEWDGRSQSPFLSGPCPGGGKKALPQKYAKHPTGVCAPEA